MHAASCASETSTATNAFGYVQRPPSVRRTLRFCGVSSVWGNGKAGGPACAILRRSTSLSTYPNGVNNEASSPLGYAECTCCGKASGRHGGPSPPPFGWPSSASLSACHRVNSCPYPSANRKQAREANTIRAVHATHCRRSHACQRVGLRRRFPGKRVGRRPALRPREVPAFPGTSLTYLPKASMIQGRVSRVYVSGEQQAGS
jgi:hypothetical protein